MKKRRNIRHWKLAGNLDDLFLLVWAVMYCNIYWIMNWRWRMACRKAKKVKAEKARREKAELRFNLGDCRSAVDRVRKVWGCLPTVDQVIKNWRSELFSGKDGE